MESGYAARTGWRAGRYGGFRRRRQRSPAAKGGAAARARIAFPHRAARAARAGREESAAAGKSTSPAPVRGSRRSTAKLRSRDRHWRVVVGLSVLTHADTIQNFHRELDQIFTQRIADKDRPLLDRWRNQDATTSAPPPAETVLLGWVPRKLPDKKWGAALLDPAGKNLPSRPCRSIHQGYSEDEWRSVGHQDHRGRRVDRRQDPRATRGPARLPLSCQEAPPQCYRRTTEETEQRVLLYRDQRLDKDGHAPPGRFPHEQTVLGDRCW